MIRRRTEESGRYPIILFESIYATSDPKSGSWLGLRWVTWDGTTGDYGSGGVESNGRFELPAVQVSAGRGAAAVRLSVPLGTAAARRPCRQPQAVIPAFSERAADGAPARRAQACRRGPLAAAAAGCPNRRWSLDFVHDQMTDGGSARVIDDFSINIASY
jgi:hypothetical protein